MGFYGAWIIRAFYAGLNVCVTESPINALENSAMSNKNKKEPQLQLFQNQITITFSRLVDKVARELLAEAISYDHPRQSHLVLLVLYHSQWLFPYHRRI